MAVDRTERLLNLVLCLLGAQQPVPRAALQRAVPGYADAPSDEAFERMFERDKEELRSMGVPIETALSTAGEVEGYRIDARDYAMPELSFTAEELTVLGLAAQAWSDSVLSAPATAALRKVEAVAGARGEVPGATWRAGRHANDESELPGLWDAIRTRHAVSFDYLALGDSVPSRRVVHPWATVRWQGAWYLACWNPSRAAERVYRLSRVVGPVSRLPETFEPVDPGNVRDLVSRLATPDQGANAVIWLPEDRGESLRRRGRVREDGLVEIAFTSPERLIFEVLASGGQVISPDDVRMRARADLDRVLAVHSTDQADA